MKKKDKKLPFKIISIILGVAIFLIFTPFVSFVFNSGSIVGMAVGILIAVIGIFTDNVKTVYKKLTAKKSGKVFVGALGLFTCIAIVYCTVITVNVISFMDSRDIPQNTPVIVLGCKVNDKTPSVMLEKRINAAYDYMSQNEKAVCIVSGGQGADENISEAQAMAEALIQKGIAEERIILEDKSTTTRENLSFSKEKLEEYKLGNKAVIVTTDYHQYRVSLIGEELGIDTYSKSSKSNLFSLPTNILRECFSVLALLLNM